MATALGWLVGLACMAHVINDGKSRDIDRLATWAIGTLLLWPLVYPIYLAKRPPQRRPVGWFVCRNLAIAWSIVIGITCVEVWTDSPSHARLDASLFVCWIPPALAIVIGLVIRVVTGKEE